jgi:hypothetical protein
VRKRLVNRYIPSTDPRSGGIFSFNRFAIQKPDLFLNSHDKSEMKLILFFLLNPKQKQKDAIPLIIVIIQNAAATRIGVRWCASLPGAYAPGYKNIGATRLARL